MPRTIKAADEGGKARSAAEGEAPQASPRRAADSAERAYRAIRQQLVEFRMRPAERINEVHLAQTLELSRTPVREALNRLASEGFVVFTPNRGFRFRGVDIDDLLHLFELRTIVETASFALACERADDSGVGSLREYWAQTHVRDGELAPDAFLEIDEAFHIRLAELSGNPEIVRELRALNARIRFIRRVQIEDSPQHSRLVDDHRRLVDALASRDRERGAEILRGHISLTFAQAKAALATALARSAEAATPRRAPGGRATPSSRRRAE